MIPHLCHFYWGGGRLSYLQYLSFVSFKKHNPDWQMNLFMPKETEAIKPTWFTGEQSVVYIGEDYLEQAKELCKVIEIDFTQHALAKPRHEVQKADIIRWYILYEYGGVWSDIDILYTRPINSLKIDFDTALVYHDDPYIGFFITKPKQQLFDDFYTIAKDNIRRNMDDTYQSLGAGMLRHRFGSYETIQSTYPSINIVNLPMDVMYPYLPNQDIRAMFFGKLNKITPNTVGLHWYNGSSLAKKYQNHFEKYSQNESIISKLIKDYV